MAKMNGLDRQTKLMTQFMNESKRPAYRNWSASNIVDVKVKKEKNAPRFSGKYAQKTKGADFTLLAD